MCAANAVLLVLCSFPGVAKLAEAWYHVCDWYMADAYMG